ncbi:MAG: GNAT family N-acetyltransferase [Acidimicrobiia bacterium]|nr:GNAT family N-acetyltransferase [Acidimicrobiia bacterium]
MPVTNTTADAIERAALRAFPALEETDLGGWILRYANGQARRANSVQALEHDGTPLAAKVASAEEWYADRDWPPSFRMTHRSSPEELDAELDGRGYRFQDRTGVLVRPLQPGGRVEVSITSRFTQEWLDELVDSNPYMSGRRATLSQTLNLIEPATAFAVIREGSTVVATGLGVADGELLGVFSVSTKPAFRRRGLARRMSESLMAWGIDQGASLAYLQVMHENTAAWQLYESMGFTFGYDYWYRSPAPSPLHGV